MTALLKVMKMKFDQKYRKSKYVNILVKGMESELISSRSYIEAHIENQKEEANVYKEHWRQRNKYIEDLYEKLASYGFKNRKEYFDSIADDPEGALIDVIEDINRSVITSEAEKDYRVTIDKYNEEIAASEKVLLSISRILPIVSCFEGSSFDDIEELFQKNECSYLLNMPSIINIDKIIEDHYFERS